MSRQQWTALSVFICLWFGLGMAAGQANPVFFKGTDAGCQFRAAHDGSWQSVDVPKLICGTQTSLKTETGSWGTIVYPFGSMTLHPQSEVLFQPNGLILRQGKYRAFIHASPRGFQFRIPQATIGIRGTIFTATGEGGVAVDTGKVEVTPDGAAPVQVGAGDAWKMPDGDTNEGIPQVLTTVEAALKAEHDQQYAAAAGHLLDALQSDALEGLSGYRDHLARKVLQNVALAGTSIDPTLAARVGTILGQSAEAWYGVMEEFLRQGTTGSVKTLLALAANLRPGQPEDPRDQIIRGLVADLEGNAPVVAQSVSAFTGVNNQTDQWTRFWGHSRTYLQIQAGKTDLPPAQISQMVSPAGLLGLSSGVARRRVAAVSSLPYGVLEAQGLYYLVRAYAAAGDADSMSKVMGYFEKNFPGSPWLGRARQMRARVEKAATGTTGNEASRKNRPVAKAGSADSEAAQETSGSPAFESVRPGEEATGTTASSSRTLHPTGVPSTPADSIHRAY